MKKIALIGWGYWGRNYAKYFDTKIDAQLLYVCDLREDMLADAKRLYPHITITKNIQDLIINKVDGVILASPASIHFKLASILLNARIPVLIEKPLTDSLKTSQELAVLAKKTHTKILVGHTFLYNQSVRYLKSEIDKGNFGKLYYLEFKRQSYGPIRDDVNIMWDFAPHDVAISRYLLGNIDPITIYATAGKFSKNDKEDIAIIVMKFPGNVMVNINVAWLYPIKIRNLTVLGDKKMAIFEDINSSEPVKIFDTTLHYPKENDPAGASFRLGDIHIPRIPAIDPLATQLRHFVSYLEGEEQPLTPIEDGVAVVAILEAINQSIQTGKEITFRTWLTSHEK